MPRDVDMLDADVAQQATQNPSISEREIDEKYPNRPRNHGKTLPFHELYQNLFDPLNDCKKKPTGPPLARKKQGPHGPTTQSPHEMRRSIIERFISRWRNEVGNDIYPAFRLIIPDKDRERAMYGLKEKTIGKLLVQIIKIDKNSDDGYNLINWKLPGQRFVSSAAGDFAGRCHAVISKRAMRQKPGDMTIGEVNELLDRLSLASKDEDQRPIMNEFYQRMNADEMMWLIRIILRQMKVGATERTFFEIWHPDAEVLFNVSSNLRRVCWELYDADVRLQDEETEINLMQCFQPQLAQFQMFSFEKMVQKMRPTDSNDEFWIEEKLDGERMQLHMVEDSGHPGGKRFGFWSRKAKDYTYLYGNGFEDDNSALTRHLKDAFHEGVRNIILDGEMITWDPEIDKMVGFGSLKTAALSEQKNPFGTGPRPLYRVFDILLLNDDALNRYTLRDRRRALEKAVKPVHRRMEICSYLAAHKASEIEPELRKVVAEASEGLVLKNPRSAYRLNQRNDDWMKVKPEYMTEFGEALDCVVIGGYYGSGRRGGNLSSFLCGLRVDQNHIDRGADPMKCYSFFKVGGGFTAADYASVRHHTEGKWHDWDRNDPPTQYIELGGGPLQYEKPDVWIRPDESIVFSVKAASVHGTQQFRMGYTLRFPRFKGLRLDRDWKNALSIQGFIQLKSSVESEREHKEFEIEKNRRKRAKTSRKREVTVAGAMDIASLKSITPAADATKDLFRGLTFYVISESLQEPKKTKNEIKAYIKAHGGALTETGKSSELTICVSDRQLVSAVSISKHKSHSIVRPSWLFDCVAQAERDVSIGRRALLLPWEPRHMFFVKESDQIMVGDAADAYDAYARDVKDVDEMRNLLASMPSKFEDTPCPDKLRSRLYEDTTDAPPGWMFDGCVIHFADGHASQEAEAMDLDGTDGATATDQPLDADAVRARIIAKFACGALNDDLTDENVTHVVVNAQDTQKHREIRAMLKTRPRLPRLVTVDWILQSWEEKTRLDEERFAPP